MSQINTAMLKRLLRYSAIGAAAILLVLVALAFLGPLMSQIPKEACLTIGCESHITIVLDGQVPEAYTLTMASGKSAISLRCEHGGLVPGSVTRIEAGTGTLYRDEDETTCTAEGVFIDDFAPLRFTVTVEWEGGNRTRRYRPRFDFCNGSCCLCKTITFDLP